jgi:two-component system CheB/CheR fusion protein
MPYSPDGQQSRGAVFTLSDVTDLRDAIETAQAAKDAVESQKNEVEQIYESSPIAMGLIDEQMRYVRLNEQLADVNGVPLHRHAGRTIRDVIPAVADHTEALVKTVLETQKPILGERVTGSTRAEPDIERIWESDWTPFYVDNEITGVSVTVREITEQVETADNLRQIMGELEHRVKNMLANVTALVNRASRDATSDREVFETLTKRITGLANTHSLLTAEQWSSAMLRDILVPETVEIYGTDRVTLSGPDVRITSEATLALGMAIHELATNAAKYGAFSTPAGHVTITWSRIADADSDRLVITWREEGGPPVTAPERRGFGSQLIRSTLEQSLDGIVKTSWEPTGLQLVVELGFTNVTVKSA